MARGGEAYNTALSHSCISCQDEIEQKHVAAKFLISIIRSIHIISTVYIYCDNQ